MTLTKKEIDALIQLIRVEIDEALEEKLEEKFREKLGSLPSKDEFDKMMDRLMRELEAMRQELALTPSHADLASLAERIVPLERLHPGGRHVAMAST